MPKITKAYVEQCVYEKDRDDPNRPRDIRWDDTLKGFGVRIYPDDTKSFVLVYRRNGRQRLLTLGKYGTLTVVLARQLAKKRLAEVCGGIDPLEERQEARKQLRFRDSCSFWRKQCTRSP